MHDLAAELRENYHAIVQRWYERWLEADHSELELEEAALKNSLPSQLRLIGEQLALLPAAERAEEMWKVTDRLDPEARVSQKMPIQEVVQEYALVTDVVREWIAEQRIDAPVQQVAYFYQSVFELTAESVRRYAEFRAEQIRSDRARYLAAVMHQLRTPLSTLSMQVELIDRHEQPVDAAAVARLRRSVRRIRGLVDGILRLERFGSSEVPVRSEAVRPAHLIDDIAADHEAEAARKGLRFEVRVNRSLEMQIDPELFTDALGNLVHNAVKYTRHGFVIVEADEDDSDVVFRVRDSGPGITPEMQVLLFEHSQPGNDGGAGIGLMIAQHAAQAQGGLIEVESQDGTGTIFSLRLPRIVATRGRDEVAAPPGPERA